MDIFGWLILGTALLAGGYVCVIMDNAKKRCHKGGCTKCGRCHRMRQDAEESLLP